MAVDTKPNLSSDKFEQFSGETLNLSGCTCIYGKFVVAPSATITISGSAGSGKVLTSDEYGNATWQESSAPASTGSEKITKQITLSSHGFVAGDVIGWSGGTYNKAIANGLYDGEVLGIVSKCVNSNVFELTQAGYVTGLTSLSANTTYFLSDITEGQLTTVEPSGDTHVVKSVLIATSSSAGWVLPYPGYVVSTGSTGGGAWGTITGLISDQTDLWNELTGLTAQIDTKLDTDVFTGYTASTTSGIGWSNATNGSTVIGCGTVLCSCNVCHDTFVGVNAGGTTICTLSYYGNDNVGVGYNALASATCASGNVAIGSGTMGNRCKGSLNVAIGCGTMQGDIFTASNPYFNVALGYNTMAAITTGYNNFAVGYSAAGNNSYGCNNIAVGQLALLNNCTGDNNIALGDGALYGATNGNHSNNIALGYQSMYRITTGSNNIGMGYFTLNCITTATGNIALGRQALRVSTASNNIALGDCALYNSTTGLQNVAIGYQSMQGVNTGHYNIAIGNNTLNYNTSGTYNIALGYFSLCNNRTGQYNIGIGPETLNQMYSGCSNIAMGYSALRQNTKCYNIALGYQALTLNTTGSHNIAIGLDALFQSSTGNSTIAIGRWAGGVSNGSRSIYIGDCAGYGSTASDRLYIANSNACTLIYGEFDNKLVKIDGSMCITALPAKTTETCGVWIDSNGMLSYGVISGGTGGGTITGGTNGLSTYGANIGLGGTLTGNTEIDATGYYLEIYGANSDAIIADNCINLSTGGNYLVINSGNTTYTSSDGAGIQYAADYSVNYTDRSLVDKAYVDTKLSGTTLNIFSFTGDSTNTGFTINHNLNQQYVGVEIVKNTSPYPTIYTYVSRPDANNVCITFETAPTTGQEYKVLITVSGGSGGGAYATLDAAINSVSATGYTLQSSDRGKVIEFTSLSATTITLPSGLTTGFQAILVNVGGGNKTLSAGAGATLNTLNSNVIIAGAYNSASVYNRGLDNWVGFGNLS